MNISTKVGLVGFFLALSVLNLPKAHATINQATTNTAQETIESRITRITEAIRQQENQCHNSASLVTHSPYVAAFANRVGGGGGFVNKTGGGGFTNGGGFVNKTGGGGFVNKTGGGGFTNGGGFVNKTNGGGFVNKTNGGGFTNYR